MANLEDNLLVASGCKSSISSFAEL